MTRRPGWRGEKRWSRADAEKPDDTKTPEVAAGPKKCHGALAPLPNVWRQRRAKRVRCTPGLGRTVPAKAHDPNTVLNGYREVARVIAVVYVERTRVAEASDVVCDGTGHAV